MLHVPLGTHWRASRTTQFPPIADCFADALIDPIFAKSKILENKRRVTIKPNIRYVQSVKKSIQDVIGAWGFDAGDDGKTKCPQNWGNTTKDVERVCRRGE